MKRILSMLTAIFYLAFILTGCTNSLSQSSTPIDSSEKKLSIVTTTFPQYDFVKEIAGDAVDVRLLLSPGMDTHSFEPSPKDRIDISNSDIFIYTGGEIWIDQILETMDSDKTTLISLMDSVDLVEEEMVEGMEHDHDHDHGEHSDHEEDSHDHEEHSDHEEDSHDHADHEDSDHDHTDHEDSDHDHTDHEDSDHDHADHEEADHDHADHEEADHDHADHEEADHDHADHEEADHDHIEYDEHVWTSPKNAIAIVRHISQTLKDLDEDNRALYEENEKAYIDKLKILDGLFVSVTQDAPNKTILIADKFPFRYLVDAYGLEYYAAFTGCSTQTDASPATLAFLIDKAKEEGIPVVFYTEQSNQAMADAVSESAGCKKLLLHSCHNINQEEIDRGENYISLMTQNAHNLEEALK